MSRATSLRPVRRPGLHSPRRPAPAPGRLLRRAAGVLGAVAVLAAAVLMTGAPGGAAVVNGCTVAIAASDPAACAGSQGTNTTLSATASAVTVPEPNNGAGTPFPNLQVTVNQTKNLVNQDVSVSWTGATATTSTNGQNFTGDYLQIFECWGAADPNGTSGATDPGPPPSQCEFGGESSTPTSSYPIPADDTGFQYSRVLSKSSWGSYEALNQCSIPGQTCSIPGYSNVFTDTADGLVIEPFQAVDGTTVDEQADYNFDENPLAPKPFWLNPYFSFDTTNEIDFARSFPDPTDPTNATGQALFQVDTGLEAPGLGCGQDIEPVSGGGTTTPQCWLVVVPRSTPTIENPDSAGSDPTIVNPESVVTSPLTAEAWANRIAIPLSFNPVGASCSINSESTGIVGNEMAGNAVASWEPALCSQPGSSGYNYLEESDDQARSNLTNPTFGSVGMSVFSNPIASDETSSLNPVVYAPLTLSGVVVGFNIDRVPAVVDGEPQPNELALDGTQVQNIYLTPRLVAKLLTQSYSGEFQDISAVNPPGYGWLKNNPVSLFTDPDFLQYNPEFALLTSQQLTDASTLLVEESNSDAASELWKWVLSDPEAVAWLSGKPWPADPTSMVVNPNYSMVPSTSNPTGFGTTVPENYPKSDSYCNPLAGDNQDIDGQPARELCILDWSPYAQSMQTAAQDASLASDGAKTTFSPTATSADNAWSSNGPQLAGSHLVMTITDTASAAQYGLETADLSRSGDDTADPTFVAPNSAGLLAGEQAMTQSSAPGVLQTNPATTAPGAYPLTMLSYGAVMPEGLTPAERTVYANFIQYAAGPGQTSGVVPGDLPAGYVPLPAALLAQDAAAEQSILHPPALPTPVTPAVATPTFNLPNNAAVASSLAPSTAPAPAATKPRIRNVTPVALVLERSHGIPIGVLRWVLPITLLLGVVAALAALALSRVGRSRVAVNAPAGPEIAEEAPPS
jgi:hypothetical protein